MFQSPALAFLTAILLLAAAPTAGQRPQLSVQTGHANLIAAIAFTRDGKIFASGSVDKTIKLWDPSTGNELRALKGHDGTVTGLAFSPDGGLLASSSVDQTIKLWDVVTGQERQTLKGHKLFVSSVAFSPDGKILASGSADQTAKLWDVRTGRELQTWTVESASYFQQGIAVAFSPDGKSLASGGESVKLWDVATGMARTLKRSTASDPTPETPVAFSPDGKVLASGGSNLQLWDVSSGRELRTLGAPGKAIAIRSIAFSSDAQTLVSCGESVKLWNYNTGSEILTLATPKIGVEIVAFSADGRMVATGNGNYTVTLWEVATGQELRVLRGRTGAVTSIATSEDGRTLASGSEVGLVRTDPIRIWDPIAGQLVRSLAGQPFATHSIAMSDDGKKLVAGHAGKNFRSWDVTTGEQLLIYSAVTDSRFVPDKVALSHDRRLVAAGGRNSTIEIFEATSGRELFTLKGHKKSVWQLAFSPNDQLLASAGQDHTIKLWSVADGREIKTLSGPNGGVGAIAFSPDGQTLASGSQDNLVLLWDIEAGGIKEVFQEHRAWVNAVAFSPDGRKLASGSEDGTVMLWDLATGRSIFTLRGHTDRVSSITFSANGKLLLSGSRDTTIKLWDVATGRELASLISLDHQDWLVVTPDGLFDGSPASWNQILWRFSQNLQDVAPVEIFFNEYYYPGLLADLYAGRRPVALQSISQKDRRQPNLKLALVDGARVAAAGSRQVKLRIFVESPAGAQDVRLFRNGVLIKLWRGDVLSGQSQVTLEADIPVVAGANRLTAYAFNRDNVKSADASLNITGAENLKRRGTLYILAAAVNNYANREFDLRYAVADATDFARELQAQEGRLNRYERVEVISLYNENATKANFLRALASLGTQARPEDGVVIYYAGHGTAQQSQFYLIPHDLGYRGTRKQMDAGGLQSILAHSLSDRELERAFETMDAGTFLLVIDACNSGQALEAEEKRRGPMNSKGLAQLAYEKGIYILTAAQSYQAALEPSELQHGLLTYALVEEGLKNGAADSEPRDGMILVREWLDYATRRVPQIQEGRMRQAGQAGRQLAYVEGEETTDIVRRNVQRPRAFYRRELEEQPFIVAKIRLEPAVLKN